MSTVFEIIGAVVIFIVVVLAIYLPVDRICNCIEKCAIVKSFGAYLNSGMKTQDLTSALNELSKSFSKNGGMKGCNDEKS